jgi:hypothetical protein
MTDVSGRSWESLRSDEKLALSHASANLAEFPGKRHGAWEATDPDGLSLAEIRPIRDGIERRVRN